MPYPTYGIYNIAAFRCAVASIPFSMREFNGGGKFSRPFAPSLDRIDGKQGYTRSNVRLVCRIANFAINVWGVEAVLTMATAIGKNVRGTEFGNKFSNTGMLPDNSLRDSKRCIGG